MVDVSRLTSHALRFSERGIALVMVLWILVLLSIVAMNFMNAGRWNSISTRNLREETASYFLALSGFHEVLDYLVRDKDTAVDFSDSGGGFWVDRETPLITGRRSLPDGDVDISISDEDSKININAASPEQLKRLFMYAGVAEESIPAIVDAILDWKDPDNAEHLQGAEDDYYEGMAEPYKAKNGPFDVPEELMLVKGVTPEMLFGGNDIKPILPLITTFGGGGMNINTASLPVMKMLGLDTFEIEAVLKQRTQDSGGFRSVPEQFAGRGMNVMSSSTLRIEVLARAKNSSQSAHITAVVQRQPGQGGFRVRTLYWKEREEGIRS